jgi:hypothetical protein
VVFLNVEQYNSRCNASNPLTKNKFLFVHNILIFVYFGLDGKTTPSCLKKIKLH